MVANEFSTKSIDLIFEEIKARAISLGFCLCGSVRMETSKYYSVYESWLNKRHHGSMTYLDSDRHRLLRRDPSILVPWAKSALVLAWPYLLSDTSPADPIGLIAGYAGSEDYHLALPRILRQLTDELPAIFGRPVQSEVFTDSAPILERELGVRAGLGWIGKNSCLLNPDKGSAFLLAEVFLDQELPVSSEVQPDRCGHCRRCIDACPTGCILPDRTIDAGRCLSTLTIENKGLIPKEFLPAAGNRLFGCDVCQSVCPWNRSRKRINVDPPMLDEQEMISFLAIDEAQFQTRFAGSALLRVKRRGLIRNLCAVLGNLHSRAAVPALGSVLSRDPDPMVRLSAASALMGIDPGLAKELISRHLPSESDPVFLAGILEWI